MTPSNTLVSTSAKNDLFYCKSRDFQRYGNIQQGSAELIVCHVGIHLVNLVPLVILKDAVCRNVLLINFS